MLALVAAYLLLPALGAIGKFEEILAGVNKDISLFVWFLVFSLGVGLLAGALPAWILSGYKPVQVLKNVSGMKLIKHMTLRKGLVVFQFSLSLIFRMILLVYYQQSHYMVTADYGYSRENILTIPLQGVPHGVAASELGRISEVERIAAVSGNFGYHANLCKLGKQKGEEPQDVNYYAVDQHFIPNMQVRLIAGSNFPAKLSDTHEQFVILNKKAVEALNLGTPQEAIGKAVWLNDSLEVQVAGVLNDFNFQNFKRSIGPLALRYKPDEFTELQVKIQSSDLQPAIAAFTKIWKSIDPVHSFEYTLFDKEYTERQMHGEDLKQISFFALMALSIACLGLLGMVTYTAQTRTKEVGIRKVMGASIWQMVLLLSKEYLKLLVIAACIALPVGYFAGSELLNHFAYRIDLGLGTLLLGFIVMLTLGLLTISSQTFKAASANPVNSLRNE
jgi:putative ABC transport system permease protein